jgi:myosin-5
MASGDSRVWVKQDGVYVAGSIVVHDAGGNKSEVETAAGKLTVPRGEILQREPLTPGEGVDQLTDLSFLHAPAIVDNLSERFTGKNGEKVVYTYCGQICIAVNPYKWMRELYTVNVMNRYMGARFEDNQPHVYAVADAAYLAMMGKEGDTLKSQSILVSGESGAGKTESVKIMMEYIAQLGGRSGGDDEEGGHTSVAEAVIRANPLLEAFGNAKTLLNNNSSRFGKFTKILIDKNGMIAGSRVDVYLLEKSRVVRQAEGERNYHIFYQLLASTKLGAEKRAELDLTSPADYEYVNEVTVDGMDDEKEFDDMYEAMQVVGIPEEKQMQSFTAVAAAMAVGKIVLEAGIADGGDEKAVLSTSSPAVVKCAELLSVPADALGKALVSRQIHARGESYEIALTLAQAGDAKDALGKALYAKLFDWLVGVINVSTQPKDIKQCVATIGVLDIFGFESFAYNSLEQLLINFANEKLQQQFTWYVFKLEQAEYEKEGIKWDAVDFQDNQPVLDVLEGYGSVLALLQEECQLQKGTDLNFRTKLESAGKRFPKVNDPESGKPVESLSFNRRSQQTFTVRHYAGPVEYDVIGFTEKNKDTLGADIVGVMTSSGSEFVRDLFAQKVTKTYFLSHLYLKCII